MLQTPSPATSLTLSDLTLPKEKSYYLIALIFSLLVWIGLAISMVGIFYAAIFALFAWLGNGLLTAYLRAEAVEVNEHSSRSCSPPSNRPAVNWDSHALHAST